MSKKIVVVGGVAGGATAIARIRRLDENAQIILFEKGEFVSFANCGLPYYIGGTISSRDSLFVSDIESITSKYNVEIRNFSEVIKIDKENKKISVVDLKVNKEYEESYDVLLLSTGSTPFIPQMDGLESENVFTLWNIPDTDKIYNFIKINKPKNAVVAGGGFIGLEMAENLSELGIKVTLVEFADQIMPPLDKDMAKLVQNHLEHKGVKLILNTGVKSIFDNGNKILLSDGSKIDTDMTLLSIGVRPNSKLAKDARLELNERGGVIVNDNMQTSDSFIYAVGDMIEVNNPISLQKTMIPLAGPANKQGRAVAANVLNLKKETYDGTIGTSVAKVFDITVASTGENEKALNKRNLKLNKDYGIALIHPMSHAGYYPGATPLTLKLIFSLENAKILGAQIVGYDGVDKRIDTIATSIHFNGTVYDLTKIELAYAPPYSSAKDPVNMAGYVATNILEKLTDPVTFEQWQADKELYTLIDVREDIEVVQGKIENALQIPLTRIRKEMSKLDKSKKYLLYCAVGVRGYIAERILKQNGFDAYNFVGGYRTYRDITDSEDSFELIGNQNLEQDKFVLDNKEKALSLDVCGLSCPGPIVKVSKKMEDMNIGEILSVKATDPGFIRDIDSWCKNTGNTLISRNEYKGNYFASIQKGEKVETCSVNTCKEKTMIVFDGDLDKAIAAFIIATGSAAMGNKVNMFFTFWGLNILRKDEKVDVQKDIIGKMFSMMMPRGAKKLGLSKMNFLGIGSKMMRGVMAKKGISSLEELIIEAKKAGVKMTACQMSMDVMGITKEELIDGVEIGGVATMLNDNDNSNMNLFI
ncbi:FAD-dependent oxidoreductase [Peptoniphilus sp. oral taxon 386]|uniref:FAD-dependent oxidoreductase n=1 Tax=Peptoniphilus sp. oral taxon 386 TaxID=652713 RepID=UPI0001DAA48A|nr:FAD-dependent oxidoreductase [Peptoniphilus sp. oral taxon 386]EFI41379.1 pyridine nucleotide-disulfide oxidoreductase [Peptoniphilus sp. oral taxon 386 str. F0131]